MTLPTNNLIREILGEYHPVPFAWQMLLEPFNIGDNYLDKDGKPSLFERPDSAKDNDKHLIGCGRILMLGDACFKHVQFQNTILLPDIGDWILYPKYNGEEKKWGGIDFVIIQDYLMRGFAPDPKLSGNHSFIGN
jgi:co-chaperonin GroES (HSP10)